VDEPGDASKPGLLRRHPVIAGVLAACTLAGAVAGAVMLDQEWFVLRRVAAGAVAGAGVGLLLTATKMF
jgi:hypothetical protein